MPWMPLVVTCLTLACLAKLISLTIGEILAGTLALLFAMKDTRFVELERIPGLVALYQDGVNH